MGSGTSKSCRSWRVCGAISLIVQTADLSCMMHPACRRPHQQGHLLQAGPREMDEEGHGRAQEGRYPTVPRATVQSLPGQWWHPRQLGGGGALQQAPRINGSPAAKVGLPFDTAKHLMSASLADACVSRDETMLFAALELESDVFWTTISPGGYTLAITRHLNAIKSIIKSSAWLHTFPASADPALDDVFKATMRATRLHKHYESGQLTKRRSSSEEDSD